jgi:hypothetical protein
MRILLREGPGANPVILLQSLNLLVGALTLLTLGLIILSNSQ